GKSNVINSFVKTSGDWDLDKLQSLLSAEALQQVMGTLPPALGRGEDSWSWGEEPNGKFSIRSAYCLILELNNPSSDPNWDRVWRWRGPSRIQHFLWLVLHNKLLTNAESSRRHLTNNSSCPRCYNLEESVSHVLRDCLFAVNVWSALDLQLDSSIQNSAGEWLVASMMHPKSLLFGIGC
ncbi:Putative ribonuclease H protein At1g65750, partial [Linum perenne]